MSFFNRLSSLLTEAPAKVAAGPTDLQLAVGALLVVASTRDDVFDAAEEIAIERILRERFDLSEEQTKMLLAAATGKAAASLELFGFVRRIMQEMDEAERVKVIEMLWEVAYADGVLDAHEDSLIRRVAGLIYVSDRERAAARRRAREKLGLDA